MAAGAVVLLGVSLLALVLWGRRRASQAPADREGLWMSVAPALLPGLLAFVTTSSVVLSLLAFFLTWGLVDRTLQPEGRPGRPGGGMQAERKTPPRSGEGR